jgi:MFS family permease
MALAMGVGIFSQHIIATMAPFITAELGLSRAQLGMTTTTLYIAGALCSPVAGPLVDRFGGRSMLLVLFASGAVSWAGMASAPGYGWLLLAVIPGGFALAVSNPITNQLISQHVPGPRQGGVVGFKQSGGQISALVAGFALPPAASVLGWRVALVGCVAVAVAGLVVTGAFVPAHTRLPPQVSVGRGLGSVGRDVRWLAAFAVWMGAALAVIFTYLPIYSFEEVGISAAHAGWPVSLMAVTGIVSLNISGRLGERFGGPKLLLAWLSGFAMLFTCAVWLAGPGTAWLLWFGAAGLGLSAIGWFTVSMLVLVRQVEPHAVGRASGIVFLACFAGLVASPIVFGHAADATGSYGLGWAGTAALFGAAGATAVAWHRAT